VEKMSRNTAESIKDEGMGFLLLESVLESMRDLCDGRRCEERSDEAIHHDTAALDCFAEPVIGPSDFARVPWLAMTINKMDLRSPAP